MKLLKKKDEILKEVKEIIDIYEKEGCNLYFYDARYSVSLMNKVDELHVKVGCVQCCKTTLNCKLQEEIAERIKMAIRRHFKEDLIIIQVKIENVF